MIFDLFIFDGILMKLINLNKKNKCFINLKKFINLLLKCHYLNYSNICVQMGHFEYFSNH